MDEGCFSECDSLKSFALTELEENKILNEIKLPDKCLFKAESLEEIELTANEINLGSSCFCGSKKLQKIVLHSKKISNKDICFSECESLKTFIVPKLENDLITESLCLEDQCFLNSKNLEEIEISANEINFYKKCGLKKLYSSVFSKKIVLSLFNDKKIIKWLEYVANAYIYTLKLSGIDFFTHQTQIYTAYEACKQFILKKEDSKSRGIVFQVETGEGKTCIVCLIAAALALMKKTVHITSSNIKLSIRDYEESYKFFKLLDLKPAILLHYDDLPNSVKNNLKQMKIAKNSKKAFKKTKQESNDNNTQKTDDNNEENFRHIFEDCYQNDFDGFFKYNEEKYLQNNNQPSSSNDNNCYTLDFYDPNLFKNSSKMNFSICGLNLNEDDDKSSKKEANVIFSTFVYFECLYLRMMELSPGSVQKYFQNCGLLIDEADSILIDEITNGTIISRTTKSKLRKVLEFVYDSKMSGESAENTLQLAKEKFPRECHDLNIKHINQMYSEIDLVRQPEFTNGKKYSIETMVVKNNKKRNRLIKNVLNFICDVGLEVGKGLIKEFTKDVDDEDNDDDDDDDDDDEDDDEEEEEEDMAHPIEFHYIVPFSYDSNGILEPNKEFNGFIQQFIAIKEWKENNVPNIMVRDMSLSYLYVSHPIFVKLYNSVCGFTGTIGNKNDKKIYKKEYNLTTIKIPSHNANQNVEFPMIICENVNSQNTKIANEISSFHEKGYPVLAIFQDLKDIEIVQDLLKRRKLKNINIFDGRKETVRPDFIAGKEGAISLGTNVCGRGTNIRIKGKPLHIIVAYYSSNIRVMQQAFGRTVRQGQKGSYRVICLASQFFNPKNELNKEINNAMKDFSIKNKKQREFVEHFKINRDWVFTGYLEKQIIQEKDILKLREAKINVNRIVAFNYEFPVCMSNETFLRIQIQKIFSILNCPNSQFTWRLFQRYIREMILQSWSLMINELDQKYMNKKKGTKYEEELNNNISNLYKSLEKYLPNQDFSIVQTFFHIFNEVLNKYQDKVINGFCQIASPYLQFNPLEFFSCQAGFKPYSLLTKSGARITNKNYKKTNYIHDPELKYERREKTNKITLLSITQKIDDIFDKIFQKVNEILGSKTFLKFFLRRTLGGCEFGVCLNLNIIRKEFGDEENDDDDFYCIVDKDPLLVFTIFVRSLIPVLATILICVLVYVASIAKKIAKWFTFPSNAKEALKKTVSVVVNIVSSTISQKLLDKIIEFLENTFNNQLQDLHKFGKTGIFTADILNKLKGLFDTNAAVDITKNVSEHLGNLFQFKTNFDKLVQNCLDPVRLMKISVLILLCIATFIINFRFKQVSIQDYSNDAKEYDSNYGKEKMNELAKKHKKDVSLDHNLNPIDPKLDTKINESYEDLSKSYKNRMKICEFFDKIIQIADFQIDKKAVFDTGLAVVQDCLLIAEKKKCMRMSYHGTKKAFLQQVLFYSTNQFPSIVSFIGYCFDKKKQYIFLEKKEKGSLENYINEKSEAKLNATQKLIIAYGVARAVDFIHKNDIVHRNINPSNIFLDSNFYPYLSDFYYAKHIDIETSYTLYNTKVRYSAPEFIEDYKNHQNSKKIDVFSFGMTLYHIITEMGPYEFDSETAAAINITNGYFPSFYDSDMPEWEKLIESCWELDPQKRPTFDKICCILESKEFVNNKIDANAFHIYKSKFEKSIK
ncbi:hypothetical protein M9Y10_034168 [Tritrichomonas musculus]|uniref:Protein kinase domain-containing protein n=1 Tax=Tritrichomonas musculus TaxID=1915356 RepID=A0ABR2KEV7_9EUKA